MRLDLCMNIHSYQSQCLKVCVAMLLPYQLKSLATAGEKGKEMGREREGGRRRGEEEGGGGGRGKGGGGG